MVRRDLEGLSDDATPVYFGRVHRGLERVAWSDLELWSDSRIVELGHRMIVFQSRTEPEKLARSRCLDDLYILVAVFEGTGRHRKTLDLVRSTVRELNLDQALELRSRVSEARPGECCSLTGSFVGKRNFNRWELEDAVKDGIGDRMGSLVSGSSEEGRASKLNLRVHLEGEKGWLGLRIGDRPLRIREYSRALMPAVMPPPVAHCMVLLAVGEEDRGSIVMDPMCGSGTIPAEASYHPRVTSVLAGDVEEEAVIATCSSTLELATRVTVYRGSAFTLPVKNGVMDAIICDLPWGNQTMLRTLNAGKGELVGLLREFRRALREGGRAVLLVEDSEGLKSALGKCGFGVIEELGISLRGRHPRIVCARAIKGSAV